METTIRPVWQERDHVWLAAGLPREEADFRNSLGMRLVRAGGGGFRMGGGDWDKCPDGLPVHEVTISRFWIADEPVRKADFDRFWAETRPGEDPDTGEWRGFVQGVSFYEAADFCDWLSEKEGLSYRLPTEAEWEFAARNSRRLNVDRMCDSHLREWCLDWYAPYTDLPAADPAGPRYGAFKCVRGGYLDDPSRYNEEPLELWMRCALPPSYRHFREDGNNDFGRHPVGFRVCCGAVPTLRNEAPVGLTGLSVHQETGAFLRAAPPPDRPYYRKRYLFPVPPDDSPGDAIRVSGFPAGFRHHHHSPGMTACPNGDLLLSVYSTYDEYDAESGLVGARLRKGCDEWEPPDRFLDTVGVNDHAPMLFTDADGTVYHFWGWPRMPNSFPFQYVFSRDSGVSWSGVRFPLFQNRADFVVRQPVNTCVRGGDGTFYVVCDASKPGGSSVLWRSGDGMRTWESPAGRTAGRHTTAVERRDGSILALGGKNSEIDGFMPRAVTRDRGETFAVSRTPFPAQGSGQRPCVLRLASGRLVMCGDYQDRLGRRPAGVTGRGCYAAWSDDDGETWRFKTLWGTQPRKRPSWRFDGSDTLGYCVLRQSPDGMIHLIATNVRPLLHFEFNEAWLLDDSESEPPEAALTAGRATGFPGGVKTYTETWENGAVRCVYRGGIADDGRFLLEGEEKTFDPEGRLLDEGWFHLGRRVRYRRVYDGDGNPRMTWTFGKKTLFCTYHPGTSLLRTVCPYDGAFADGVAQALDRTGAVTAEVRFEHGAVAARTDLRRERPAPLPQILRQAEEEGSE